MIQGNELPKATIGGFPTKTIEQPTLRDWIAIHALSGLCALHWRKENGGGIPSIGDHAILAYKYADAMLKARGDKP